MVIQLEKRLAILKSPLRLPFRRHQRAAQEPLVFDTTYAAPKPYGSKGRASLAVAHYTLSATTRSAALCRASPD